MKFSFGADPELMLTKDGRFYSAIGVVQGDRENRINVLGHEFFYDNVLAEAAVRPGKTRGEVVENFRECLKIYAKMVKPYTLTLRAAHEYADSQMSSEAARDAGCSQEWCAYTLKVIDAPTSVMKHTNFRTAGGHVHLGGGGILQNSVERMFVVYMLDLFLAVPAIFMDTDKTSKERRTMYGFAGSHREKDYGLEYRPLSAFWLGSPRQVELVWDICSFVLDFVDRGQHQKFWKLEEELLDEDDPSLAYQCFGYDTESLRHTINTCDKKSAETFMTFIEQFMPAELFRRTREEPEGVGFYEAWGLK